MGIRKTPIDGVCKIYPKVSLGSHWFLLEVFKQDELVDKGIPHYWVQENQSSMGSRCGLHCQHSPGAQAKLAGALVGKLQDVCLALRRGSPTFGIHHAVIPDSDRQNMLFMPEGFAHGFSALEDAIFIYKNS